MYSTSTYMIEQRENSDKYVILITTKGESKQQYYYYFNNNNNTFRQLWLLNFMELYMLWRKLKSWVLLMFDWNVTLPWFVLHLLLGKMFLQYFVIDEILVLIIVKKSGLGLLIFFVKRLRVLISWLIQDLFIENPFIGIIGFHLVCYQNSLLIGIVYLCIVFVNI